jgi:hypothetical protein
MSGSSLNLKDWEKVEPVSSQECTQQAGIRWNEIQRTERFNGVGVWVSIQVTPITRRCL